MNKITFLSSTTPAGCVITRSERTPTIIQDVTTGLLSRLLVKKKFLFPMRTHNLSDEYPFKRKTANPFIRRQQSKYTVLHRVNLFQSH